MNSMYEIILKFHIQKKYLVLPTRTPELIVILLTKKKIYKNRQNGKVTKIAEIKHELSVQLQYEQYYAEIAGKLPIFEQKWLDLIQILG